MGVPSVVPHKISCELVFCAYQEGNEQAEEDAKQVGQYPPSERVESPEQLAGRLLTTVYMGTVNSSQETKDRAASLARQVLPLWHVAAAAAVLACIIGELFYMSCWQLCIPRMQRTQVWGSFCQSKP